VVSRVAPCIAINERGRRDGTEKHGCNSNHIRARAVTRKGNIDRIKREFPYRVALPAEALHDSVNGTAVFGLANRFSAALPPYHLERDGRTLVVFCFSHLEDARTFAKQFGGKTFPA
jgi:hypothetical protein